MKVVRLIILVASLLGSVGLVRADVGADLSRVSSAPATRLLAERSPAVEEGISQGLRYRSPIGAQPADPLEAGISGLGDKAPAGSVPSPQSSVESVRELPPLPDSNTLFLSAALSAGVWHALRKARSANWANLPEWYHADAPQQIGHVVVFDPISSLHLLATCPFDEPVGAEPTRFPDTLRELPSRCESQYFLSSQAPRGPPVTS